MIPLPLSFCVPACLTIPTKYTCEGAHISPPLQWSSVPAGAKGLL